MSDEYKQTSAKPGPAPCTAYSPSTTRHRKLIHAARRSARPASRSGTPYSPFAVHGIDDAMGIKMTILPWFTLGAGLTGLATAILLQWWTNAYDYPWIISGKPFWSIPANVPIMFELTVLLSAVTTLVGMLL